MGGQGTCDAVVGVVTVNWNRARMTAACLRATQMGDHPPMVPVVADNGSASDPTPELAAAYPEVAVVRMGANRGYGAGCNLAAKAALERGTTHLLFLNNDAFVEPDAIAALVEADRAYPGSILAPKIVYAHDPDRVWSAGGQVRRPWMQNEHVGLGDPAAAHEQAGTVDWASGCALFVSATTWERIGPFDESFFLYLEDLDWCLRAAERGVPTRFVPGAHVRHEVSASSADLARPEVLYYGCRNTYLVALRHARQPRRSFMAVAVAWTLIKVALRSLLCADHRSDPMYRARNQAILDAVLGRTGPLAKRAWPA